MQNFYLRYCGAYIVTYLLLSLSVMITFYVSDVKGPALVWLAVAALSTLYPAKLFLKDKGRLPSRGERTRFTIVSLVLSSCLYFSLTFWGRKLGPLLSYIIDEPCQGQFCDILHEGLPREEQAMQDTMSHSAPGIMFVLLFFTLLWRWPRNEDEVSTMVMWVTGTTLIYFGAIWLGFYASAKVWLKRAQKQKPSEGA